MEHGVAAVAHADGEFAPRGRLEEAAGVEVVDDGHRPQGAVDRGHRRRPQEQRAARRQRRAGDEAHLGTFHLVRRRAADLADALDDVVHPVDVALREVTAAGVDRDRPAELDLAGGDERPALALLAEAPVLQLQQHGDREAVVQLGDVDVVGAESGPPVQRLGHRLGRQGRDRLAHQHRELDAGLRVGDAALGDGTDERRWLGQVGGPLGGW